MLIKLLNHTAMKTENDWRTEQLGFLMNLGLFKVENGLPIGCELAASLKSAFFGALDLNLSKLEDLQAILSHLVTELHSKLTFDNLETILRNPLTATLQQFNEPKLATEALNELFVCYDKTKRHRKNSDNPDEICNDPEEGGNDPLWIEVNPKNEDNPLSRKNEESDDDMDDEKDNALEEDGSQSEEEGLDEKMKLRMNPLTKNFVWPYISNGYQTDEESVDMDDMSDTEGENLNKALADAFIQFKPNLGRRKKQSKDQEQLMHFRVRVLDLIEIYLDSTPSMVISLEIMLPLLQAIEYSVRDEHQKPLNDRLKACLKKLSMLKKFTDTNDVNDKVFKWTFEKFTGERLLCIHHTLLEFVIGRRNSQKKRKHSVLAVIEDELHNYFYRRDCLTPYVLFKNILQLSWDGILNIVPLLFKYIFSGDIKPFKKNQAAELLKIFYTNQRYIGKNTDMIIEKLSEHHGSFFTKCNPPFQGPLRKSQPENN
ncbi:hypothetical protein NQ317_018269 [Molorchus minor]|uniref:Telomere length regulation protein TEL2 homolog n=1 Tax=Molorchus minor TaxID=1323400 RepID=A0ABQ9K3R6_9CUCU|nr:hypothetical protein NQ317_018269 [Molorchus minor]